jgi:hypothetical protein
MERKPRKKTRENANYPTHDNAKSARRQFLKILGKSLLAIPAASLANACGVGRKEEADIAGEDYSVSGVVEDTHSEPDYELAGGAPFEPDEHSEPDYELAGDEELVDVYTEPDYELAGGLEAPEEEPEVLDQPDIKEEDWGLDGIIDDPDFDIKPEPEDVQDEPEDVQEDDYWLSGGIGEPIE